VVSTRASTTERSSPRVTFANVPCSNCKDSGHTEMQCVRAGGGSFLSGLFCSVCKEEGHDLRPCPIAAARAVPSSSPSSRPSPRNAELSAVSRLAANDGFLTGLFCRDCRNEGHDLKPCPLRAQQRQVVEPAPSSVYNPEEEMLNPEEAGGDSFPRPAYAAAYSWSSGDRHSSDDPAIPSRSPVAHGSASHTPASRESAVHFAPTPSFVASPPQPLPPPPPPPPPPAPTPPPAAMAAPREVAAAVDSQATTDYIFSLPSATFRALMRRGAFDINGRLSSTPPALSEAEQDALGVSMLVLSRLLSLGVLVSK
jgi:hypothetical protein